mmetsp:Transcript_115866/g.204825  ORF Transcript_115866/g.204825 Transcript_115866/m.204825 type:complete len:83 (+) Transcript_115866:38-286(+)
MVSGALGKSGMSARQVVALVCNGVSGASWRRPIIAECRQPAAGRNLGHVIPSHPHSAQKTFPSKDACSEIGRVGARVKPAVT